MTTEAVPKFREEVSKGNYRINFNLPQTKVMLSEADIIVLQAGTGVGKTSVGACWMYKQVKERGPGDYLVVAPTYPLMEARVLPELKENFVYTGWGEHKPGAHPPRIDSKELNQHGEPAYRIFLASAANPESLESATVKACWIDELAQKQFTRQSWEAIRRRVAFYEGRILGTTTLYEVSSWYKTDIYDRWKAGDPRIEIIMAKSTDNPAYSVERFNEARDTMPYYKFAMFHLGEYEKPAGLIYDKFNEETQVIPRIALPDTWPRYTGHDFGLNNTAAIWLAQDPGTGFIYLYRTYRRGGRSVGQHVEEFKNLSKGEHIMKRVGGNPSEEEIRYGYTAAGWPMLGPEIRDVEAGIARVYSFIARGQFFVFNDQHEFLNEILTYSRKLDENYEATDIIENKSTFHLMDSLRYILSSFAPERVKGHSGIKIQVFGRRPVTERRRRRAGRAR